MFVKRNYMRKKWKILEIKQGMVKTLGFVLNVFEKVKPFLFINVQYPDNRHKAYCPIWPYRTFILYSSISFY